MVHYRILRGSVLIRCSIRQRMVTNKQEIAKRVDTVPVTYRKIQPNCTVEFRQQERDLL